MRLPIAICTGLIIALSFNTSVLSKKPPVQLTPTQQVKLDKAQLKVFSRLWKEKDVKNYRYRLSKSCFCAPAARGPVLIVVKDGVTTSVTSEETGQAVDPELFKQYDSVPKLFAVIQDAIDRKAASLNVKYDAKLGYPTQINIDYDTQIADEELYLTIDKFEIIK
ncbi:hypothetical protein B6N60_03261 [Richelia sinica FACHB-800]|uniref:Uncharacterized protein n=1 Tax=Richelia sinica FACHB-800 TaxID=1357546 RepID=A0A975Y5T0_9NOST|nr:DUF6174 domain-containing protein [Richelia sinica]MBD2663379.1 hypothetical protein [Richelia sinica FACHB-800]QXE24556.1 hypothetical protein B6N60_03261 [Richelia sinica FACHB-800]